MDKGSANRAKYKKILDFFICFTSLREQRPLVPRCSLAFCVPLVASVTLRDAVRDRRSKVRLSEQKTKRILSFFRAWVPKTKGQRYDFHHTAKRKPLFLSSSAELLLKFPGSLEFFVFYGLFGLLGLCHRGGAGFSWLNSIFFRPKFFSFYFVASE